MAASVAGFRAGWNARQTRVCSVEGTEQREDCIVVTVLGSGRGKVQNIIH